MKMPNGYGRSSHEERGLKSLDLLGVHAFVSRSSHEERGLKLRGICPSGPACRVAPRMRSVD